MDYDAVPERGAGEHGELGYRDRNKQRYMYMMTGLFVALLILGGEVAIELRSNNIEQGMRSFGSQRVLLLPPAARLPWASKFAPYR